MTAVMAIGSTMSSFAAEAEPVTKVTYKFECTSFVEAETLKWSCTSNANGWGDGSGTYDLTQAGAFEITVDFGAEVTSFFNMGYFENANGSETQNTFKCTGMVLNGVEFTFVGDAAGLAAEMYDSNANYSRNNSLPNVWNATFTTGVIAQSAKGSTINGGDQESGGIKLVWSDTEFAEDVTTPSGEGGTTAETTTAKTGTESKEETTTASTITSLDEIKEATAFIMFTDGDWAYGNWDEKLASATTTVKGAGKYSVTLNAAEVAANGKTEATGTQVFCIDVIGGQAGLPAGYKYVVTDIEVLADGTAIAVDGAKVLTGDIEEKGNFRIELYNAYGLTKDASPIDAAALKFANTLTVNFSLDVVAIEAGGTSLTTGIVKTETAAVETKVTPNTGDASMVALYVVMALGAAVIVLSKRQNVQMVAAAGAENVAEEVTEEATEEVAE